MSVVPLPDVKTHLNITVAAHDTELGAFIAAAEAALAELVGPLASTEVTARVDGGRSLVLPEYPVLSLVSVTPVGGTALTVDDLHVAEAGVVTYDDGSGFPSRAYDVVYNAGRASLPADLSLAVLELVRHLWQTQRGPSRRPGSTSSDSMANTLPGAAHTMPFRVTELITPHLRAGFA